MQQLYRHTCVLIVIFLCYSCGIKRYIPAGEKLYDGAKIQLETAPEVKGSKVISKKLKSISTPKKNKTILGRPNKVWWWYFIGESKKEKGFKYWLRNKLGDPPVFASALDTVLNARNMKAYLESHGHFNSTVSSYTLTKGYRTKAVYQVKAERPYRLGDIAWRLDSSRLSRDILSIPSDESLLRKGEQYDADKIKAETERINTGLKEKGYYFFKPQDILTYVDTNQNSYTASVLLALQPETSTTDQVPYRINKIFAVVQGPLTGSRIDSTFSSAVPSDDIHVMDSDKQFKPGVLSRAITFRPGMLYAVPEQNKSLSRLNSYEIFKFIKSEFKRPATDSTNDLLDVYYYTSLARKKKVQFELGGFFRSNNYNGGQVSASWKNRNLFRGAETFTFRLTGSFEVSVNDSLEQNNNWRIGAEASIQVPRFLAPVITGKRFAFMPKTRFLVSYDWVRRQNLYTEYYAHGRYELNWSDTVTREHRLTPFSLTVYNTADITSDFLARRAQDLKLDYTVPPVINAAFSYHYQFTNVFAKKRNVFNLHASVETSGTILGLIKGNDSGYFSTKIGKAYFTQYIRSDAELRFTRKLAADLFWVSRFFIGVSYPYGNSPFLPFNRQFIIGGANSLRGFLPRQIGPGSTVATTSQQSSYPQIGGDFKLEMNTELRFPLMGRLKGAVFIDGGNIWMKDTILYSEEGKLSKNFYKEIALDAGLGIRLDITLLIIRLDLGLPFYKPFLPLGDRWVLKDFNFGSSSWRKENLVLNVAIGYPF